MQELRNSEHFRSGRCGRRAGFTLLELLVVIAIIGILAALLFPALAKASHKAQRINCLNRIKQWGVAFKMYADENDGWVAREGFESSGRVTLQNWTSVRNIRDSYDVWYNALPPYLSQLPASEYAPVPRRSSFFDNNLLFHCPLARFPRSAFSTVSRPLFPLAMNSQLIQVGRSMQFAAIENADPSRIVLFLDNMLEGEEPIDPYQDLTTLGQSGAWADRFSGRHERGGNIVFADGHATWFPGTQVVETSPASLLRGGPILPPKDIAWEVYPY